MTRLRNTLDQTRVNVQCTDTIHELLIHIVLMLIVPKAVKELSWKEGFDMALAKVTPKGRLGFGCCAVYLDVVSGAIVSACKGDVGEGDGA
jgi:hypothetical protein